MANRSPSLELGHKWEAHRPRRTEESILESATPWKSISMDFRAECPATSPRAHNHSNQRCSIARQKAKMLIYKWSAYQYISVQEQLKEWFGHMNVKTSQFAAVLPPNGHRRPVLVKMKETEMCNLRRLWNLFGVRKHSVLAWRQKDRKGWKKRIRQKSGRRKLNAEAYDRWRPLQEAFWIYAQIIIRNS